MRKKAIVVGLGETGMPLFQILDDAYPREVRCFDLKEPALRGYLEDEYDVLNVCFGYSPGFERQVRAYQKTLKPKLTIVHSTVPVGTTARIPGAVHSPILGRHGQMKEDLLAYTKWVGGKKAAEAADFLQGAKIPTKTVATSQETELLKLMCLAKYGVYIAFAGYQKTLCEKFGVPFGDVLEWDIAYNRHVAPVYTRPMMFPPEGKRIGGHCVVPGTRLLNKQFPNKMLKEILRYG